MVIIVRIINDNNKRDDSLCFLLHIFNFVLFIIQLLEFNGYKLGFVVFIECFLHLCISTPSDLLFFPTQFFIWCTSLQSAALANKLLESDMTGGTFTVSNIGEKRSPFPPVPLIR